MQKDTLTVTDKRTGKSYEIGIKNGAIDASDFAVLTPTRSAPIRPGLRVTASESTSSRLASDCSSASATTSLTSSR